MPEIEVPMPKLSMTMEEGELISWRKHEGDQVRAGEYNRILGSGGVGLLPFDLGDVENATDTAPFVRPVVRGWAERISWP